MFGFLKKVVGAVGKVVGVAGKVATLVPGLGGPASVILRAGGRVLSSVSAAERAVTDTRVLLSARGLEARLQTVSPPGALSKASPVMPGGAVLQTNYSTPTIRGPAMSRLAMKKVGQKRKTRRGKRARIGPRRGRRGKGKRALTAAQLRAGFGGKRRMKR